MNSKVFSQRFNRELSYWSLPDELVEKSKAVSKVFGVTRHLANEMLLGYASPSAEQLDNIAEILEVHPAWLSGQVDKKEKYPTKAETRGPSFRP